MSGVPFGKLAALKAAKTFQEAEAAGVEEAWLEARDDRVRAKLEKALNDAYNEAQEAQRLIDEKNNEIRRVRKATREGHWYDLRSYLTEAEIESLCEVSPVDLDIWR
jgi:hypothetical protein